MRFVEHPLIKEHTAEERIYQRRIAKVASEKSTLVVLPTGLGKTVIALRVIADILLKKKCKILFLAPTKPLVEQHAAFLKDFLVKKKIASLTGEISAKKRKKIWDDADIIVSTPQVIKNDILAERISLYDVGLIIFDEAHRARGDYAYTFIGDIYKKVPNGIVLGITASPGDTHEEIIETCTALNIKHVEIRSEDDIDVLPYVHDIKIRWVIVPMPQEFKRIHTLLKNAFNTYLSELQKYGYVRKGKNIAVKDLLDARKKIREDMKNKGKKSQYLFHLTSVQACAMTVNHAMELLETQGISTFLNFIESTENKADEKGSSKFTSMVVKNENIIKAKYLAKNVKIEHPKLDVVKNVVKKQLDENSDSRIIVFTHFRDTSDLVVRELEDVEGVRPVRFVGQATRGEDKGLRQKEQVEIIDKFRKGIYNVLVATSVAEEGLDIPSTDLVVFYEPIPSEIRTIQRRGRTGRRRVGKVIIMITKDTRDEAYYWSAKKKEKRMKTELEKLRQELKNHIDVGFPGKEKVDVEEVEVADDVKEEKKIDTPQKRLSDFFDCDNYKVIVDVRELKSDVVSALSDEDVKIIPKHLDVGDYILSDRIAVERKSAEDFSKSIIDGRLFKQIKEIKNAYPSPILVIEGKDFVISSSLSINSIYGAIAAVVADFGVTVVTTDDANETANFIVALLKREMRVGREGKIRNGKKPMNLKEKMEYVAEGLPGVSGKLANRLLMHFGMVRKIFESSKEELMQIKGIGDKTANEIITVINTPYPGK